MIPSADFSPRPSSITSARWLGRASGRGGRGSSATLRFRGEASLRTWLMGIAHHRCGDAIKARTRRSSKIELDAARVEDHGDPAVESSEKLEQARLIATLEGCLGELSPELREPVLLRFLSGMTYEEPISVRRPRFL